MKRMKVVSFSFLNNARYSNNMYMNSLIEFLKNAITCVNIQSFTHLLLGFNEDLNFTNVESIVFFW